MPGSRAPSRSDSIAPVGSRRGSGPTGLLSKTRSAFAEEESSFSPDSPGPERAPTESQSFSLTRSIPKSEEIEIEIDPRLSLPKNAERFFTRARKTDRALEELGARLEAVQKDLSFWEGFECDLRDAATLGEIEALEREASEDGLSVPTLERPSKKKRPPEALGPRSFRSHRGSAILVGRSGRSNDELTFDVAKPHDLWFHAAEVPGAHVVLRVAAGETADEREIQEAAELAAYYSKARENTAVDVIVTERRNVSRIKGAPRGLVKLTGETTTLRVAPRRTGVRWWRCKPRYSRSARSSSHRGESRPTLST